MSRTENDKFSQIPTRIHSHLKQLIFEYGQWSDRVSNYQIEL